MALPAIVLVRGGGHAAGCWEPTVDEIRQRAAEVTVLAVDLPGRRGKPGDLLNLTIADFVDSVVGDIEAARHRTSIEAIGGVQTVIPIDTCHDLMVSEPTRLAEILVERCRLYA
jgi:hypothetical protein